MPGRGITRVLDLSSALAALNEQYPGISAVYLFGSRAHGSKSLRSDFDLVIEMTGTHLNDFMLSVRRIEPYLDFFVRHGDGEVQSLINHSIIRAANVLEAIGARLVWQDGAWCGDESLRTHEVLADWAPGITISIDDHSSWRDPAVSCDVLVVTALESERAPLWDALESRAKADGLNTKVRLTSSGDTVFQIAADTARSPLSVVLTRAAGRGNVRSAVRTSQALTRWHPSSLALLGICGGRREEVKLGDILLGAGVVEYESVKVDAGTTKFDGTITELTPAIRHAIVSWPQLQDVLDRSMQAHNMPNRPVLQEGYVASGEKVVNDGDFIAALVALHRRVVGIEMEATGLVTAARESAYSGNLIFMKIVVDHADGTKDDRVHKPGMRVLADLFVQLATNGQLT